MNPICRELWQGEVVVRTAEFTGLLLPFVFRHLKLMRSVDTCVTHVRIARYAFLETRPSLPLIVSCFIQLIELWCYLESAASRRRFQVRLTDPHAGKKEREREREKEAADRKTLLNSNTGSSISALLRSVYTSAAIVAPREGNLIYNRACKWHYQ
jgi:hypothetical protein